MLVSLQLRKLHDVQGASRLQNMSGPCGIQREQLVALQVLEVLLLPVPAAAGAACPNVPRQGPAGTHSRDGGPAAAR